MRSPLADIFLPQDRMQQDQSTPGKARPAGLSILENVPLARYTRFEVGGPARILADAATEAALTEVLSAIAESGEQCAVIGGGTNLVVADQGFPGVIVRYTNPTLEFAGRRLLGSARMRRSRRGKSPSSRRWPWPSPCRGWNGSPLVVSNLSDRSSRRQGGAAGGGSRFRLA